MRGKLKGRAEETDADVGRRLRARRKILALTQRELGQAVGVSYQQIQKYETGTDRVGAGRLQRFADYLGVPISYFFGEESSQRKGNSGSKIEHDLRNFLELPEAHKIIRLLPKIKGSAIRKQITKLVQALAE